MTHEEFEKMQKLAIEQLMSGKSLTGKDGVFAPLLKQFLESAIEGEMDSHLNEEERARKNKRNGRGRKTVKSSQGEIEIRTPQDRHSTFEPELIRKRQRVLGDSLESKIISLYSMGMSLRQISDHIEEMYDTRISPTMLSEITDRVVPEIKEWQSRPLDEVYPIVWLDAMHFKVKESGTIVTKAVYSILALNKEGRKELLGLYISESEGAKFWLRVLTDLHNRGVKDILIACIDNLKGFPEAIASIYPKTDVQTCMIHQLRNSMRYISTKDKTEFLSDTKKVYKAETKVKAELELDNLENKWEKKYPTVIRSWRNNWDNLSTYFKYTEPIRRIIYTTNTVEGYHRQVRKITKTKGAFTSEEALMKLIYLASMKITDKWKNKEAHWQESYQQLSIHFEGRMPEDRI